MAEETAIAPSEASEASEVPEAPEASETSEVLEATIPTINRHLEGSVHSETQVPFNSKEIVIDGNSEIGVFPDFSEHVAYETRLPENLHESSDIEQAKYCNEQLRQDFEKGGRDLEQFSERQQAQIHNRDTPDGYTWHHNEDPGRMQLVDSEVHDKTGHTGGRSLWGGGSEAR